MNDLFDIPDFSDDETPQIKNENIEIVKERKPKKKRTYTEESYKKVCENMKKLREKRMEKRKTAKEFKQENIKPLEQLSENKSKVITTHTVNNNNNNDLLEMISNLKNEIHSLKQQSGNTQNRPKPQHSGIPHIKSPTLGEQPKQQSGNPHTKSPTLGEQPKQQSGIPHIKPPTLGEQPKLIEPQRVVFSSISKAPWCNW